MRIKRTFPVLSIQLFLFLRQHCEFHLLCRRSQLTIRAVSEKGVRQANPSKVKTQSAEEA